MIHEDLDDTKEVVMDKAKIIREVAKVSLHQEVQVEVEVAEVRQEVMARLILEIQDSIFPIIGRITYKIE